MCNCTKRDRWVVTLSNGLHVTKTSEAAAKQYAAAHPGSSYAKVEGKK